MSISGITQTLATTPTLSATLSAAPQPTGFTTTDASAAASVPVSGSNPLAKLSSDMQSFLLHQQSQDSGTGQTHHRHGHHGGTHVDAPNLPGGKPATAAA